MAASTRKKRRPKLLFTTLRNIGWHVNIRHPKTGLSYKHKFDLFRKSDEAEAEIKFAAWWVEHLAGRTPTRSAKKSKPSTKLAAGSEHLFVDAHIAPNSLAAVTAGFLAAERDRIRPDDGPRIRDTIEPKQYDSREKFAIEFLEFLNRKHGDRAVGRITLAELSMLNVEEFNKEIASDTEHGSDSQVRKRMQVVKAIIDCAGRPEFNQQMLTWNWDSRRTKYGRPDKPKRIPTVQQLKRILKECDEQRRAMLWLGIGLGFTQSDLSDACPVHFDADSYDMRRGKTRKERFGDMQPLVWKVMQDYYTKIRKPDPDERIFITERKQPLVHDESDAVQQWWTDMRKDIGETKETLSGFGCLRHLGATEFGSRPGCSLSSMRTWLGHATSSLVADRYMRPLAPEHKEVIAWVREALRTGTVDLD